MAEMCPAKNMHFSLSFVVRNGHATQFLPMKQKQQFGGCSGLNSGSQRYVHIQDPMNVALFGTRVFANVIKISI